LSAPNILSVTSILGKSTTMSPTATPAAVVSNAASSGKVLKVNTLIVSNIDGSSACNITINYYPQDDIGGTGVAICSTVSVPANASLVVIDKSSCIYLEEDKSIGAIAGATGDLQIVCSWEEIA
jgi:hypothetical protein